MEAVLRYSPKSVSRASVRRFYNKWRESAGIPRRCDIPDCTFHTGELVWRGSPLPLILDHINGHRMDNRPQNLRLVCPNCDSQFSTRGGANRGRVLESEEGKFVLGTRDGRRHLHLLLEPARLTITGYAPTLTVTTLSATDDA